MNGPPEIGFPAEGRGKDRGKGSPVSQERLERERTGEFQRNRQKDADFTRKDQCEHVGGAPGRRHGLLAREKGRGKRRKVKLTT